MPKALVSGLASEPLPKSTLASSEAVMISMRSLAVSKKILPLGLPALPAVDSTSKVAWLANVINCGVAIYIFVSNSRLDDRLSVVEVAGIVPATLNS